jgi:flagellar hook-associated protein 2
MVKANKESPLYKLSNHDAVTKYAIDIKENAKSIQNVVASLSDSYGTFADSFRKKVAVSSDESSVSVKYVGNGSETEDLEEFQIEVKQLSSPQVNQGNFLKNDSLSLTPGTYTFDLNTNSSTYEFQYTVKKSETNLDILNKIAGLVNRSNLGITASIQQGSVDDTGLDTSALVLTSRQSGRTDLEHHLFEIIPSTSEESTNAMDILGIDHVEKNAENSIFTFNGETFSSLSNNFTINGMFDLSLNKVSEEGKAAEISFKTDVDAVADNIMSLIDAYNGILNVAEQTPPEATGDINKLFTEMCALSRGRRESLGNIGLVVADNGTISIDKEKLEEAIQPDRAETTFTRLTNFKNAVGDKANKAAINPMHYVNKVVVNYKNPTKTFPAPYFSSVYSGMMLDRYV